MYYLICGAAAILIVSIILFAQSSKKAQLTVEQAIEKYREQIEQNIQGRKKVLDEVEANLREVQADYERVEQMRLVEQDRAKEAHAATERLLAAEHERARAELGRVKEIEELKLKQEMEAKRRDMQSFFDKENATLQHNFEATKEVLDEELSAVRSQLDEFQAKRMAVNEAIRREKEIQEKENFYSIDIPKADQEDIRVLQDMDLKLHNRDVIPKLIWELFVRRPCQEMIKRVTNGKKVSGIYKITYKKTGEAYVGKTTDILTRWTNHCKTAIGLEGAARATLHNRLAKDGLWNYTWEILEEVDKDHLSSREAFYIDLYGTKQQLNMKSGDKNGTQ